MLVTRHMPLYWEVLRWLAIIAVAIATAICFAARLSGGAD
jgi:hypothetical protein